MLDKDPKEATLEELLDCTNADNAVERIMYRKEVSSTNRRDFIRLNKGELGQSQNSKKLSGTGSKTVCFKHLNYQVSESNGHVSVYIEKKVPKEISFYLRTTDDTAKANEAYEPVNQLVKMEVNENEKEFKIGIIDDPDW